MRPRRSFPGTPTNPPAPGYIRTLYIHAGDRVGGQTTVADVYNDKTMKLKVPFLSGDAAAIAPGTACSVTLTDTGEMITGTVTSVSNMDETISGGRIVRYVHVEVANPGGLTTAHMAVVTVGDLTCAEEGNLRAGGGDHHDGGGSGVQRGDRDGPGGGGGLRHRGGRPCSP